MWRILSLFAIGCAFCAGMLVGAHRHDHPPGEKPVLVSRSFILWLPPESADEPWPQFQRSISLQLFAQIGGDEQCQFMFPDDATQPEALRGSHWITYQTQLCHITRGGPIYYKASWQNVPPPFGAKAESETIEGSVYWIKKIPSVSSSPFAIATWEVAKEGDDGAVPIFLGTGLFSK